MVRAAALGGAMALASLSPLSAAPAKKPPPQAVAVPPSGVLTKDHLRQILLIGMRYRPSQFTADPTTKYIGRDFKMTVPTVPPSDEGDEADWEYNLSTRWLGFARRSGQYQVLFTRTLTGTYSGSNLFGVRVNIRRYNVVSAKVRSSQEPEALYRHEILNIAPDAARALTRSAQLEIEGQLEQSGDGAVKCETEIGEPTISDPVDERAVVCDFTAIITRVTLLPSPGGKPLRIWSLYDKAPQ